MLRIGILNQICVHLDYRLIWPDKLAIASDADGSEDVVAGDHDRLDVGLVELLDGGVSLLLDQVLHDDQPQEVGLLLQLVPGHVVHLLPPGVGVQALGRRGDHPQALLRVALENGVEVGRDGLGLAQGGDLLRSPLDVDVELGRALLLRDHCHPLHGRVERVRLQAGDLEVGGGGLKMTPISGTLGRRDQGGSSNAIIRIDSGIELLLQLPFDGVEQLDIQRVSRQFPLEFDEGVAACHGMDQS